MSMTYSGPQRATELYFEQGQASARMSADFRSKPPEGDPSMAGLVLELNIPDSAWANLFAVRAIANTGCQSFGLNECDAAIKAGNANNPVAAAVPNSVYLWVPIQELGDLEFDLLINTQDAGMAKLRRNEETPVNFPTRLLWINGKAARWQPAGNLSLKLINKGRYELLTSAFAIDFGTTNTCAAFWNDRGEPEAVKYRTNTSTPSVVLYNDRPAPPDRPPPFPANGTMPSGHDVHATLEWIIGDWAATQPVDDEQQRQRRVKQKMDFPAAKRMLPIGLGEKKLSVDQIYFDFVKRYFEEFQRTYRRRLMKVKATYPPEYPVAARNAVLQVYSQLFAGVLPDAPNRKNFASDLFGIDEASAAAMYHFWRRLRGSGPGQFKGDLNRFAQAFEEPYAMLVFDLGGGTTDVSVVRVAVERRATGGEAPLPTGVRLSVLGTASLNNLGGDNFTVHVLRALKCRIALAMATAGTKASPVAPSTGSAFESGTRSAVVAKLASRADREREEALQALKLDADRFMSLLDDPGDEDESEEQMLKALEPIETLAEKVLPTQWSRIEKLVNDGEEGRRRRDVDRARAAFLQLWPIAETYKIQLSRDEAVALSGEQFAASKAVMSVVGTADIDFEKILLKRDSDLYRRIRPMVRRAVLTCRSTILDLSVKGDDVRFVHLVGNSCQIPLVRQEFERLLAGDIPTLPMRIENQAQDAKSCVALGACVAFQVQGFGINVGYDISIDPVPERLGWEIGVWERSSDGDGLIPFHVLFRPGDKPSTVPSATYPDHPNLQRVQLFRRRPAVGNIRGMDPEFICEFVLRQDGVLGRSDVEAPPGKLLFKLISPTRIMLIRGQTQYQAAVPKSDRDKTDCFSGYH